VCEWVCECIFIYVREQEIYKRVKTEYRMIREIGKTESK